MRDDYQQFLETLTSMLGTLSVKSQRVDVAIKLTDLPGLGRPAESLQVTVQFATADCILNFGRSALDPNRYGLSLELQRPQHPTLFVKDYLADRRLASAENLSFSLSDCTLPAGMARQIETVRSLLDGELRPVLDGGKWIEAPFDWGDYK